MRLTLGDPVLLFVGDDGLADCELLHLPTLEADIGRGGWVHCDLTARWRTGVVPLAWPALCGLRCWLYAYDGVVRGVRFCALCLERWRPPTPATRNGNGRVPHSAHRRPRTSSGPGDPRPLASSP